MSKKKILIVGAGKAGRYVCRAIKDSEKKDLEIVGFIDDDVTRCGEEIENIKILGNSSNIASLVSKHDVDEIIIAIPSADGKVINKFVNIAIDLNISHKIVPRVREIIEGKVSLSSIRKVEVSDLVGRPVVKNDVVGLKKFFKEKVVMVTGAAGSIGSELSAQIAIYKPKKLILFDIWENGMYEIRRELLNAGFLKNIYYIVGNIQDIPKLEETFKKFRPNYVFHAAAYKHVPLMEDNPIEAIKNNILGTFNLSNIASKYKVQKFVLVSTDKAAEPVNIMGMTKLFAEKIVRSMQTSTKYMVVRFGNVLDSNGSVVPLFRKQIEKGGPVTITHKKMTRYFMTIPEASGLILKSAFLGKGGELFVLDMGDPISIQDLAEKMIRLSGLMPNRDIKITYIGVRKGEKLTEKLFSDTEKLDTTKDKKIFMSRNGGLFVNLESKINQVVQLINMSSHLNIKSKLKKLLK